MPKLSSLPLPDLARQVSRLPIVGARLGDLVQRVVGEQRRMAMSELAGRLEVPVSTLERWIRQGHVPVHCADGVCEFDDQDLHDWLSTHSMRLAKARDRAKLAVFDTLEQSIARGGVYAVEASDDIAVLFERCISHLDVGRHEQLLEQLLEREEMASTGIGHGVAVPHPRTPLSGLVEQPTIAAFLLDRAVDFGALDGEPVYALFLLLSPNVNTHLNMLSHLAHCLTTEAFRETLETRPDTEGLLRAVRAVKSPSGLHRMTHA